MPSADHPLFHAATSIFIILALIPSLKAVICQTGGTCGEGTGETYTPVNCDKSCFSFVCMNRGKQMKGFGCEADLRAVCPDVRDETVAQLYGFKNLGLAYNFTYHVFRCAGKKCANGLMDYTLYKAFPDNLKKKISQLEQAYKLPAGPKTCQYPQYTTTTNSPLTTSSTTSKPKTTTEKTTPKAVTTTTEATTTVKILPTAPHGEASTTDINDPATTGKTGNSTEEEYYDYGEEEVEVKNDGNQLGISKVIGSILGAWIFALFL